MIMDKITSFFLAPFTAFFLPQVYREAARSSRVRGFLYIAYGSLLLTALVMALFMNRAATSDEFIQWMKREVPVVLWTPKGLSLENGQKTVRLTHPILGPIAAFDMDRSDVTDEDMGQLFFFVTSKKIFFREITGRLDARDVTKTTFRTPMSLPSQVRITGQSIENLYRRGKRAFMIATPLVVFPIALIVLLIVNVIYSAVGLLLNLIRTQKLNSGAVFNLTCFATGTSLTLIGLKIFTPFPSLPLPIDFLISLIYLAAAILRTDNAHSTESAPTSTKAV